MKTYTVSWTIELDAATPLAAAKLARSMQTDKDTTATVYVVADQATGVAKEVDLTHGKVRDKSPPTLVVEVTEGVAHVSGRELPADAQAVVVDYDTANGPAKFAKMVRYTDGKKEKAAVFVIKEISETRIHLDSLGMRSN